jgi:(1->4)-alpha-D-glucan 1-alpha-D-glucosylmutase
VAAVVPRLVLGLAAAGGWGDTVVELPAGRWRDVVTGAEVTGAGVRLADLLDPLPVALLVAEPLWEETS